MIEIKFDANSIKFDMNLIATKLHGSRAGALAVCGSEPHKEKICHILTLVTCTAYRSQFHDYMYLENRGCNYSVITL